MQLGFFPAPVTGAIFSSYEVLQVTAYILEPIFSARPEASRKLSAMQQIGQQMRRTLTHRTRPGTPGSCLNGEASEDRHPVCDLRETALAGIAGSP